MRDEVQASVNGEGTAGCATSKGSAIMGALQGKRYGSVATGEEDAQTDIEMDGKPQPSDAGDEILGMDPMGMPSSVQPRRHRCKKWCCACTCLLLFLGTAAYGATGGFGIGVIPSFG